MNNPIKSIRQLCVMFITQIKIMHNRGYFYSGENENRRMIEKNFYDNGHQNVDPIKFVASVFGFRFNIQLESECTYDMFKGLYSKVDKVATLASEEEKSILIHYFDNKPPKTEFKDFIDSYITNVKPDTYKEVIIIIPNGIENSKRQSIFSAAEKIIYMKYTDLAFSIFDRPDAGEYTLLTVDQTNKVFKTFGVEKQSISKILTSDPNIKQRGWYNNIGQIVKVKHDRKITHSVVNNWINYRIIYDTITGFKNATNIFSS